MGVLMVAIAALYLTRVLLGCALWVVTYDGWWGRADHVPGPRYELCKFLLSTWQSDLVIALGLAVGGSIVLALASLLSNRNMRDQSQ